MLLHHQYFYTKNKNLLHGKLFTAETFYTKELLQEKQFSFHSFCARSFLHHTPYTQELLYSSNTCTPEGDASCSRNILYTPNSFHQKRFTPECFLYTPGRTFTPQAFHTSSSFTPEAESEAFRTTSHTMQNAIEMRTYNATLEHKAR